MFENMLHAHKMPHAEDMPLLDETLGTGTIYDTSMVHNVGRRREGKGQNTDAPFKRKDLSAFRDNATQDKS